MDLPVSAPHARLARYFVLGLGAYLALGAVISLLGWILDVRRLTDWNGGGMSIQPNGAVVALSAGLAIICVGAGLRWPAMVLGMLVVAIGAATLFEHATGLVLGIDGILGIERSWGGHNTVAAGRMGLPASLAWTIGGTGIALTQFPRAARRVPALGLCLVLIGAAPLTGYLFGADVLYALPKLTAISLQMASFTVAAGLALIASVPSVEPMRTLVADTSDGVIVRRTLPFVALLPLGLGIVDVAGQRQGLYDAAAGTAYLVLILVGLLCAVLWRGARAVQVRERELAAARQARSRAQSARLEMEGRIAALLEGIHDAFASFDDEWRYTYLNNAGERAVGKSRDEVLGMVIWQVFPGVIGTEFEASLRRAARDRCVVEFEAFNPVVGRWFSNRAYPTPGGGVAIYFRDLTETREARAGLQQSEARLAAFLNQLPIGAGIWQKDHGWLIRNAALNRFVRESTSALEPAEVARWKGWRSDGSALTLADWPGLRALDGEVVNPGTDFLHTLEDGSSVWTRVSAAPFRDANGAIIGAITLIEDVDRQKRIEQSLVKAQSELIVTTDHAPVMLAHCDTDGRFLFVNEPYAAGFAQHRDQVIGRLLSEVVGEAAYRRFEHHVEEVLKGEEVSFELLFPRGPARPGVFHVGFTPERDHKGVVIGFVAALFDITDRKRAEDALRDADRRKDEFLATLSHELRNPLAPITTCIEILRRAGPDPVLAERTVGTLERQVRHMVRLVDDLLDVSRITRNALTLRTAPVDLASIITQAVEAFQPQAERARQAVVVDAAPGAPMEMVGDRVRLVQILGNLLSNAGRYSDAGRTITVTARSEGNAAVISVSDQGLGIAADELERIFEPFTQLNPTIERSQGGLGIGLSLARRLAGLHGGSLQAFSRGEGEGSQFVLRLPLLVKRAGAG